jgi:hypothetical protein
LQQELRPKNTKAEIRRALCTPSAGNEDGGSRSATEENSRARKGKTERRKLKSEASDLLRDSKTIGDRTKSN